MLASAKNNSHMHHQNGAVVITSRQRHEGFALFFLKQSERLLVPSGKVDNCEQLHAISIDASNSPGDFI